MKFFPSKSNSRALSRTEALACIPQQNSDLTWQELESGEILFTYPIPLSPFFQSLYQRFNKNRVEPPTKKLQLDEMGSYVWKLIDGERSVKEIISAFTISYNVTPTEAETAVTSFLKTLGQRGFIGLS